MGQSKLWYVCVHVLLKLIFHSACMYTCVFFGLKVTGFLTAQYSYVIQLTILCYHACMVIGYCFIVRGFVHHI